MGIGDLSGMITDDSEIFSLDNLKSEKVGRACAPPDRGDESKRG